MKRTLGRGRGVINANSAIDQGLSATSADTYVGYGRAGSSSGLRRPGPLQIRNMSLHEIAEMIADDDLWDDEETIYHRLNHEMRKLMKTVMCRTTSNVVTLVIIFLVEFCDVRPTWILN